MKSFASVLLLMLLNVPTSTGAAKTSSARYGIPRLAPGQIWVSSVPVGLEVRVGKDPDAKPVLGRTPLVVKRRNVGRFLTVSIRKGEYGGELPNQIDLVDFSGKTTHSIGMQYGKSVEDLGRAITYELPLPGKQTVIALFQSRDSSLSDLARLYPPGSNFRFSDAGVKKRLEKKGVPPEYVRAGIRLLHRGGKIALPGRGGWLIAEVSSSGQVDLLDWPANPKDVLP
jgi:hypothetical protein